MLRVEVEVLLASVNRGYGDVALGLLAHGVTYAGDLLLDDVVLVVGVDRHGLQILVSLIRVHQVLR